VFKEEIR